ncbi:nucleolar protein 9 isoform X2 [Tachypleus tridentatus]|uniref:nucleolar protein 9 isoform X2 n=1 Tax=Tachypleus tridentatus TaxID=6853 RepID=UPI003FD570D9
MVGYFDKKKKHVKRNFKKYGNDKNVNVKTGRFNYSKSNTKNYPNRIGLEANPNVLHTSKDVPTDASDERLDNESLKYFTRVFERVKSGFDNEDEKKLFVENVSKQTEGKEVPLSRSKLGSFCMEMLLNLGCSEEVLTRFMEAFGSDLRLVCTHHFASHVVQSLVIAGVQHLQKFHHESEESESTVNNEPTAEEDKRGIIINWIVKFSKFCLNNMDEFIKDVYACHILRTLLQAVAGYQVPENIITSYKHGKKKKFFKHTLKGIALNSSLLDCSVPQTFLDILTLFAEKVTKQEDLQEWIQCTKASPVLQTLLLVLEKRHMEMCQKLVKAIIKHSFHSIDNEGLPAVITSETGSHVTEILLMVASEKYQKRLWKKYLKGHLVTLTRHFLGNFVAQKLLEFVKNKEQFEEMFDEIIEDLEHMLTCQHTGIIISLAKGCQEHGTRQTQLIVALMNIFHCTGTEENQNYLVPSILHLIKRETYQSEETTEGKPSFSLEINLHGSVLLQKLLKFQKPIKVVNSLLTLKPEKLVSIACDAKGSHVIDEFFKSANVGEKRKARLVQYLKLHLVKLACDKYGSRILDSAWSSICVKTKTVIAQELSVKDSILRNNTFGQYILGNFKLYLFKSNQEEWRENQGTETRKHKFLSCVLEDDGTTAPKKKKFKSEDKAGSEPT